MKNWYQLTESETLDNLGVTSEGLSSQQADSLLEKHGKNVLEESKKKSVFQVFLSQFADLMVIILIIAAIVASTRIWLVTITMYEWVLILVLIFGGAGLVAKVLFANNKSEKSKKDKSEQTGGSYTSSVDDELDKMKKNMK